MIYNKGTVSYDQWLEKLKEAAVDENINEQKFIAFDQAKLQNLYWEGADIYEAIKEINQ